MKTSDENKHCGQVRLPHPRTPGFRLYNGINVSFERQTIVRGKVANRDCSRAKPPIPGAVIPVIRIIPVWQNRQVSRGTLSKREAGHERSYML